MFLLPGLRREQDEDYKLLEAILSPLVGSPLMEPTVKGSTRRCGQHDYILMTT